jgi:hypothetical protein
MSILILAERVAIKVRTEFHERKAPEDPLVLTKSSPEDAKR